MLGDMKAGLLFHTVVLQKMMRRFREKFIHKWDGMKTEKDAKIFYLNISWIKVGFTYYGLNVVTTNYLFCNFWVLGQEIQRKILKIYLALKFQCQLVTLYSKWSCTVFSVTFSLLLCYNRRVEVEKKKKKTPKMLLPSPL